MFNKEDYSQTLIVFLVILVLASPLILFKSSHQTMKISGYQSDNFDFPFSIVAPDTIYYLPEKLKEISGLAYHDPQNIYTINDEKGILYLYNFDTGTITSEIEFAKDGDYEALARNNNLIYASINNGKIKVINLTSKKEIDEINTPLSQRNNVEGMCFDSTANQLLIACKGELKKEKKRSSKKGIYSYNLSTKSFDKDPYFIADLKIQVKTLKPKNLSDHFLQKMQFNSRLNMFAPSGMAIDPIEGHLYLLGNRGKILMVIDKNKNVLGVYFLNQQLYGQPEGIAFDSKGNLFISNEEKSSKANIVSIRRNSSAKEMEVNKQ